MLESAPFSAWVYWPHVIFGIASAVSFSSLPLPEKVRCSIGRVVDTLPLR
jgi:hypothetical protein